jgi:hypothetical protein
LYGSGKKRIAGGQVSSRRRVGDQNKKEREEKVFFLLFPNKIPEKHQKLDAQTDRTARRKWNEKKWKKLSWLGGGWC